MIGVLKKIVEICKESYCRIGGCDFYKGTQCMFINGAPIKWNMKHIKTALKNKEAASSTSTNTTKVQICPATKEHCDRAELKVVCGSAYGTCQHQGKL